MTCQLPPKVEIERHIPSGYVIRGYTADQMLAAYQAGRDSSDALLRQALGQLECNTENMRKGMSKSIQKLCARENTEAITALRERLGEKV